MTPLLFLPRLAAALIPGDTSTQKAIFILLILAGATVRLVLLGDIPAGLHQDEASVGYDTWAILEHGADRHGYKNPVNRISWGGGESVLYGYLSMPFIKAMGLNELSIRLTQALMGVMSLFVMYYAGRRLAGGRFALFALFALAISPWHIMMSRWGLDANLLPFVLLLSFAFLLRAFAPAPPGAPRPAAMIPAFFLLALALYAYATAYLFVPLFTLGVLVYGIKSRAINFRYWAIALAVMAVIAIPIALLLLINQFDLEPIKTSFISIPKYTGLPRYTYVSALFSPDVPGQIWVSANRLLAVLITGHDQHLHNAIPGFGYFYRAGFYLSLFGAMLMIYDLVKNRRHGRPLALTLLWLTAALLTSITLYPNINQMNSLWLPQLIVAAYGLFRLWTAAIPYAGVYRPLAAAGRRLLPKTAAAALVIWLTASFAAFTSAYFDDFRQPYPLSIHLSYSDALRHIMRHAGENETVYSLDRRYIYALFYSQTDPRIYLETVQIPNRENRSQKVDAFDRYAFGVKRKAFYHGKVFLAHNSELPLFPESDCDIAKFSHYSAVYCRRTLYDAFQSGDYAKLAATSTWDVYHSGKRLIYHQKPCAAADTEPWFFLHLFPANPDDLPDARRQYGFDNLPFHFDEYGGMADGKCLAIVPLPDYEIVGVRTGQYLFPGGAQLWRVDFPAGP